MVSQRAEDDKYLGFLVSVDGTGSGTVGEILQYLEEHGIDHSELELIAGDGTNTNTGYKVIFYCRLLTNSYIILRV